MIPSTVNVYCSLIWANNDKLAIIHYFSLLSFLFLVTVCTKGSHSLNHAEVNHACGSYVYTMGILYRQISTWRTKQLVNLSRCYVSAKPVWRLFSQELVEVTIFRSRCHRLRAFLSQILCRSSPSSCYYLPCPHSPQTSEFLSIYLLDLDGLQTRCTTSVPLYL